MNDYRNKSTFSSTERIRVCELEIGDRFILNGICYKVYDKNTEKINYSQPWSMGHRKGSVGANSKQIIEKIIGYMVEEEWANVKIKMSIYRRRYVLSNISKRSALQISKELRIDHSTVLSIIKKSEKNDND